MAAKSYKLDKDGYVVVKFFDHFNNLIIEESSSENENDSLTWDKISNVDPDLAKMVASKQLTEKNILNFEMTDLVRGSYYNEYLKNCVREYLKYRPLPIKTHIYTSKGEKVECKLFPHQIKALTFMRERESINSKSNYGLRGGIIKMEMGLGKSLTAITHSLISERPPCKEKHGENGFPTLIIASKTVMLEWKSQGFEKFFDDTVKVLYLHSDFMGKSIENVTRKQVVKYDFVISTYEVCVSVCRKYKYHEEGLEMGDDHSLMKDKIVSVHCRTRKQADKPLVTGPSIIYTTPWEICYLDESQRISNPDTKTYLHIMGLYARRKWCLTGTPIRNFCFVGETRIITNEGNIPIRNLVRLEQNNSLRVLSYNISKDIFEYKKIENGWELKTENGLITITMGNKKITCTPDHKILTMKHKSPSILKYIEAKEMKKGDFVVHYSENETGARVMNIPNKDQEQIMIGSYLGNGHFRVLEYYRTTLSVTHSEKQKGYLEWKAKIFQKRRKNSNSMYYFSTDSIYFPFDGIQSRKTHVPQDVIDKIDDLALLVWYFDNGSINNAGNNITLASCKFDDSTRERLTTKLQEMNIECKVPQKKNAITLNVKGTRELISRIYKYDIPECMRYKIDCKDLVQQKEDPKIDLSGEYNKVYKIQPVTDIKYIENPKNKTVFDIQIEDNHNFVIGNRNDTGCVVSNCTDIWSQFRFCGYTGVERKIEWKRNGYSMMKSHNLTKSILSMDYEGANIKIPLKREYDIIIRLEKKEKECYNYVQGMARGVYDQMMNGLVDFASVLALFTRLRQCSIAPYLLTRESKREKGTLTERKKDKEATDILKDIYKGSMGEWVHDKMGTSGINSTKMKKTVSTIYNIPQKDKVLVFSMFTSVLDLLADSIKEYIPSFEFVQIDGDTKGRKREELINKFRREKNIRGLLMTYKVGSEGLNLTEANHVICIEPWWTNAVHNQAKARCYRNGQTQKVEVHNIYIENSIEERVVEICKEKDKMANSILEGTGQKITQGTGLDKYTLGRILGVR